MMPTSLDARLDGLRREHDETCYLRLNEGARASKGSLHYLLSMPAPDGCTCGADAANARLESMRAELRRMEAVVEAAVAYEAIETKRLCREDGRELDDAVAEAEQGVFDAVRAYLASTTEKENTDG